MKNFSIKGILLGLVGLILLDSLAGMLLMVIFAGEISVEAVQNTKSDTLFLILRMFVGATALIAAGYLVEKIAKVDNLINSAILGLISVLLTVLALNDSYPFWYLILSYLYQFPSALAGGYIYSISKPAEELNKDLLLDNP